MIIFLSAYEFGEDTFCITDHLSYTAWTSGCRQFTHMLDAICPVSTWPVARGIESNRIEADVPSLLYACTIACSRGQYYSIYVYMVCSDGNNI